ARVFRERRLVDSDRLRKRSVVAALVALALQGICLGTQKSSLFVGVPGRHELGGFPKMPRSVEVMEPGHGDVAAHAAVMSRTKQPLVGGCLGLPRELLSLV